VIEGNSGLEFQDKKIRLSSYKRKEEKHSKSPKIRIKLQKKTNQKNRRI